jgi:Uma2 family endonuclease
MSATAEPKTRYKPEDLLSMPGGKNLELVDGDLVEKNVSALSSWVALRLGGLVRAHGMEWVLGPDCGYQCFTDAPGKVRRPDLSFLRQDRLSWERFEEGYIPVAPDLAVEVASRNDLLYEVEEKAAEYLGAGVKLVWIIRPRGRMVEVQRTDGSIHTLREHEDLSGEDVLHGFRCRIDELFPPAPPATP